MVSYREVNEILAIIDRLDCESLVLEYDDLRLAVSRNGEAPRLGGDGEAFDVHSAASGEQERSAPLNESVGTAEITEPEQHGWSAMRAPMAGTFYRGQAPTEPPFVEVGAEVAAGQVVGLLEVMKLYTELKSEQAGTVVRIDVDDGTLVEYDQPIVWIEPQ